MKCYVTLKKMSGNMLKGLFVGGASGVAGAWGGL